MEENESGWRSRCAALLRQYKGDWKQVPLAAELKIAQSTVSTHMKTGEGLDPDVMHRYMDLFGIPLDEVLAALGYPVSGQRSKPATVQEIVKADPSLSEAAKTHFLNQYQLLRLATLEERRGQGKAGANPALKTAKTLVDAAGKKRRRATKAASTKKPAVKRKTTDEGQQA